MWPHFVDLLEKANTEYPDRVFIHFPEAPGFLTYGEAYAWVQQKVLAFQREGVKSGERVGICLPQGSELVITLLALQCMGVSIFLFDPEKVHKLFNHRDDPEWLRLKSVIQGCQFSCIVSQKAEAVEQLLETLSIDNFPKIILTKAKNTQVISKNPFPSLDRDKNAEAYVVTSSGSTGEPKLIAINGNVLNFCGEFGEKLQAFSKKNYEQGQLNAALDIPLSFDPFLFLIYVMLNAGGRLTIPLPEEKTHLNQTYDYYPRLYDYYKTKGVNVMVRLPTALSLHGKYLQYSYKHTPLMILSTGEELTPERLTQFFKGLPHHQISVFNCWGPSEGGIGSTLSLVKEKEEVCSIFQKEFFLKSRRLGLITLKDKNNPRKLITTPGIKGEICWQNPLGDEFLGYIGREDLTKEKSIEVEGERWITSGDVGYFSERGEWYFHKRLDSVKHAGKKMELTGIKDAFQSVLDITQWELLLTKTEPQWILVAYSTENPKLTRESLFKLIHEKTQETAGLYLMDYSHHWPVNANGKFNGKKVESDFMEKIKDTTKSYRESLIFYLQLFLTKTISEETLLDRTFEELGLDSVSYKLFINGLYDHPRFQPWPHLPAADNPQCYYEKVSIFVDMVVEAFELLENVEMLGDERAEILIFSNDEKVYEQDCISKQKTSISIVRFKAPVEEEIFYKTIQLKQSQPPYLVLSAKENNMQNGLDKNENRNKATWFFEDTIKKLVNYYFILIGKKNSMHQDKNENGNKATWFFEDSIENLITCHRKFKEREEKDIFRQKLNRLQEQYRHRFSLNKRPLIERQWSKTSEDILKEFYASDCDILTITGAAGVGKTTTLNALCLDILDIYGGPKLYVLEKLFLGEDALEKSFKDNGFTDNQIKWLKKKFLLVIIDDISPVKTPLDAYILPEELIKNWPKARFLVTMRTGDLAINITLSNNSDDCRFRNSKIIAMKKIKYQMTDPKDLFENLDICDFEDGLYTDDYTYTDDCTYTKTLIKTFENKLLMTIQPILPKFIMKYLNQYSTMSVKIYDELIRLSNETLRSWKINYRFMVINPRLLTWTMDFFEEYPEGHREELYEFLAKRWLSLESQRFREVYPKTAMDNYKIVVDYANDLLLDIFWEDTLRPGHNYKIPKKYDRGDKIHYISAIPWEEGENTLYYMGNKTNYYAFESCPVYCDEKGSIQLLSAQLLKAIGNYRSTFLQRHSLPRGMNINSFIQNPETVHLYNPEGTNTPIFFLPPVTGKDVLRGNEIQKYFHMHPLYSLQHPGFVDSDYVDISLQQQVNYYSELINTIYLTGNILLLGYSYGGLLAVLVGKTLTKEFNREVLYIGNIDGRCPRLWQEMREDDFRSMLKSRLLWISENLCGALSELSEFVEEVSELDNVSGQYSELNKQDASIKLKNFIIGSLEKIPNVSDKTNRIIAIVCNNLCSLYEEGLEKCNQLPESGYLYTSTKADRYYPVVKEKNLGWTSLPITRSIQIENATHFSLVGISSWGTLSTSISDHISMLVERNEKRTRDVLLKQHLDRLKAEGPSDYYLEPHFWNKDHEETLKSAFHAFIPKEKRVFVIQGASGAGKSYFLRHYLAQESEDLIMKGWIPLYITLNKTFEIDIRKALDEVGFKTFNYNCFIDGYGFLLVIDGFDEMPVVKNYFTTQELGAFNFKWVISCSESERNLKRLRNFIEKSLLGKEELEEVTLSPITDGEIEAWIEEFSGKDSDFTLEKARRALKRQEIRELITTPLSLRVFYDSFIETLKKSSFAKYEPYFYYRDFTKDKISRSKQKYTLTSDWGNCSDKHYFYPLMRKLLLENSSMNGYEFYKNDFQHEICTHFYPVRISWNGVRFSHRQYAECILARLIFNEMECDEDNINSTWISQYDITKNDNVLKFILIRLEHFWSIAPGFSIFRVKGLNEVARKNLSTLYAKAGFNFAANVRNEAMFTDSSKIVVRDISQSFERHELIFTDSSKKVVGNISQSFLPVWRSDVVYPETTDDILTEEVAQHYEEFNLVRCGRMLAQCHTGKVIHKFPENAQCYIADLTSYFTLHATTQVKGNNQSNFRREYWIKWVNYSFKNNKILSKEKYKISNNLKQKERSFNVFTDKNVVIISSPIMGVLVCTSTGSQWLWIRASKLASLMGSDQLNLGFEYDNSRKVKIINKIPQSTYVTMIYFYLPSEYIKISKSTPYKPYECNGRIGESYLAISIDKISVPLLKPLRFITTEDFLKVRNRGLLFQKRLYRQSEYLKNNIYDLFQFDFELLDSIKNNEILSDEEILESVDFRVKMSHCGRELFYNSYCFTLEKRFTYAVTNAVILDIHTIDQQIVLKLQMRRGITEVSFSALDLYCQYMHWETASPDCYLRNGSDEVMLYPILYNPLKMEDPECYLYSGNDEVTLSPIIDCPVKVRKAAIFRELFDKVCWADHYGFLMLSLLSAQKNYLLEQIAKGVMVDLDLYAAFDKKIREYKARFLDEDLCQLKGTLILLRATFNNDGAFLIKQHTEKSIRSEKYSFFYNTLAEVSQMSNPPEGYLRNRVVEYLIELCKKVESRLPEIYGEDFESFYVKAKQWDWDKKLKLFEERKAPLPKQEKATAKFLPHFGLFAHGRSGSPSQISRPLQEPTGMQRTRRNSFS